MNGTITPDHMVQASGYVARCVVAATLALICARGLGLGHPVWASVSALVVSQERIGDTRRSLGGRAMGTLIGVSAGLTMGLATARLSDPQLSGVAASTLLCALVARARPEWRTCLWTGPIVLLTASAAEPLAMTAFHRAAEVLIGGVIGAVIHELTARAVDAVTARRSRNDHGIGT